MKREPPKRRLKTAAEREALKASQMADAAVAILEHEKAQAAFHRNHERLKAERLARETEEFASGSVGRVGNDAN